MAKTGKRRETLRRNSMTRVDRQEGGVLHGRREERMFRGNSLEGGQFIVKWDRQSGGHQAES